MDVKHKDVQDFINQHLHCTAAEIMLHASKFPEWDMKVVAQQLVGKQLAKSKLPRWFVNDKILYPIRLSMEQCSSEATAAYKNQILAGKSFEELQEYISAVNVFMPNDENYHRLARLKFSNYRALAQNKDWNASHSQRHQLGARSLSYSSQNKNNDHLVDEEWYEFLQLKYNNFQNENEFRRAQKIEAETLLSGHLLCTQGDRVSMANSVETRMPFLDPSIAAFSLGLDEKKDFFSSKSEKEILKNIYMGRLPKTIIDRKKFPFRAPDSQLFLYSHTGRDFVNSYLDEVDELEEIFNSTKIKNFFEACLKDGADSPRDNFAFVFVKPKFICKFSSRYL